MQNLKKSLKNFIHEFNSPIKILLKIFAAEIFLLVCIIIYDSLIK